MPIVPSTVAVEVKRCKCPAVGPVVIDRPTVLAERLGGSSERLESSQVVTHSKYAAHAAHLLLNGQTRLLRPGLAAQVDDAVASSHLDVPQVVRMIFERCQSTLDTASVISSSAR